MYTHYIHHFISIAMNPHPSQPFYVPIGRAGEPPSWSPGPCCVPLAVPEELRPGSLVGGFNPSEK